MIGSTLMTSDGGCTLGRGTGFQPVRNAALDEWLSLGGVGVPPANPRTRYGSDGFYGYESGMFRLWGANINLPPIQLLHVGERWYQPGIGRFVQRDPIGLVGGLNVYAYCANKPLARNDPAGLYAPNIFEKIDKFLDDTINGKPAGGAGALTTAAGAANYSLKWGIGKCVNRTGAVLAGILIGWNSGKELVRHHGWDRIIGDPLGEAFVTPEPDELEGDPVDPPDF
jgi:RHS repeat-associated protein